MNAIKIFVQIILICLLLAMPTVADAELQGNLFGDDVVTVDGETFNIGELKKALNDGNIDAAESIYNDFVKRREQMLKSGTHFGILDCYLKHCYARILYLKQDYKACIATEDEVLAYLREYLNEGHEKNYNWLNQIHHSLRFKERIYKALNDYENALKVQTELVNFLKKRVSSDNLYLLSEKWELFLCYKETNDYKTAIEIGEELLPQIEKKLEPEPKLLRNLKLDLATCYSDPSRYSDAAKLFEEILQSDLEVYGENDEKTLLSSACLIGLYFKLNKYKEGGILLDRIVPIAENLPDDSELKYHILLDQALYYTYTGQYKKAIKFLARIPDSSISSEDKVYFLEAMATMYLKLDNYSKALQYIAQAWDIYEKIFPENTNVRISILQTRSSIYLKIGNKKEGLRCAQEAFDLSVELYGLDSKEGIYSRDYLADYYYDIKQYDKALELYKENYELSTRFKLNDFFIINSMRYIAWNYYHLGDYSSGIWWAEKAANESMNILGEKSILTQNCQVILAKFYMVYNNTSGEGIYLDKAIEILEGWLKERPEYTSVLQNLALAYGLSSRYKDSIPFFEKVIEQFENRADSYGSLTADEKRNIFSEQTTTYLFTSDLYYRDNNFRDAFRTFERGRSRLLIDSYSEQIVKSNGVLNKQEIDKLNEYKVELANYANLIDAAFKSGDEQARFNLENEQRNLSNEYATYKKFLQDKYPKYKNASQANKLYLERDKNILPADTAFVDYMIAGKTITAFVFDNSGDVKAVQFKMPEDFFVHCNWYRELLAYPNLETMQKANVFLLKDSDGKYYLKFDANIEKGSGFKRVTDNQEFKELKKNLAKEFGDVLLAPLAGHISKYTNLIIAPDEGLNALPFETLEFNGKLAVETFNISYVPSFSVLKLMHEAGEKNSKLTNRQDLYAMGNAFYGDNNEDAAHRSLDNFFRGQRGEIAINQFRNLVWKNLPGSKEEINRVSKIFSSPKIFSEKSASESNLKASNKRDELSKYKYLLFSTHGIFIPYAPEYSAIVLSQGVDANEDGYVTIGEWAGLDLNSDVVFLSACESGLGDYQAGEGIVGIPYALTIAGNKNTVMSLWKVYDAYTPEFVATFFKKMQEGKSAVIAINETKREFLKSDNPMYRDPAVWSAFVMYGF